MIDAHAHLQDDAFKDDLKEVIKRAKRVGMNGIVCASVDFKTSVASLELCRTYDHMYPCVGLAPYSDLSEIDSVLKLIEDEPDIVAVGEIGLDWPYKRYPEQIEPFKRQIELAKELDLPVVVHSRSAGKHCLKILEDMKVEKVVMHSYGGSIKDARRAWDLQYYFSVPVTVIKSPQKRQLVQEIPPELLLLESDSPVLNPQGGRNEPSNLAISRDYIANLLEVTPRKIDELTENNAKKIFGIK